MFDASQRERVQSQTTVSQQAETNDELQRPQPGEHPDSPS